MSGAGCGISRQSLCLNSPSFRRAPHQQPFHIHLHQCDTQQLRQREDQEPYRTSSLVLAVTWRAASVPGRHGCTGVIDRNIGERLLTGTKLAQSAPPKPTNTAHKTWRAEYTVLLMCCGEAFPGS